MKILLFTITTFFLACADERFVGGTVEFHPNGQIKRGYLNGNQLIDGIYYKNNTFITFHKNGRVSAGVLSYTSIIDGVSYASATYRDDPNGIGIRFHDNGQVKWGILAHSQTIDEVSYFPTLIFFYSHGEVKQGVLSDDLEIDGTTYPDGNWIRFNADGSVNNGHDTFESGHGIDDLSMFYF